MANFTNYQEETLDPGWSFVVGSAVTCFLLHATLPCLVSLGGRYERRRKETYSQEDVTDHEWDERDGDSSFENASDHSNDVVVESPTKFVKRATRIPRVMPDIDEQSRISDDLKPGKSSHLDENLSSRIVPRSTRSIGDTVWGFADSLLIPSYQDSVAELKIQKNCSAAPSATSHGSKISRTNSSIVGGGQGRQVHRKVKDRRRRGDTLSQHNGRKNRSACRETSNCSHIGSAMSKLHHDDVSFTEAIDSYNAGRYQLPMQESAGEIDVLWGERAWWRPNMIACGFDRLVGIADWDEEMEAIFKISTPLSLQSFANGFLSIVDVALIGHFVGTAEANAFVVTSSLTWMTTTPNYGFCEVLGKNIPTALGMNDDKIAGIQFNTSLVLFSLGMIPTTLIWCLGTYNAFGWLGFDAQTAALAQEFAYLQVMNELVAGVDYCFHLFLDITGHERLSTYFMIAYNIAQTFGVIIPIALGQTGLVWIGVCRVTFSCCVVFFNVCIVVWLGWMEPYMDGFLSVPLSNREVLKTTLRSSSKLGIIYFLGYAQWDFLLLFACALGPAEVATWAMLGYVWSIIKYWSDGIADAAEVRCAFHLVSNAPEEAPLSAYKSLFFGVLSSTLIISILFMVGEYAVAWITPEPILQTLMIELFPLIAIAHMAMTIGAISWALVGAQGRHQQASVVYFVCSWGMTIPFSAIFTYGLNIDLQGMTSAFVLGLALAASITIYILMRSEWQKLVIIISDESKCEGDDSSLELVHTIKPATNMLRAVVEEQPTIA